MKFCYAYRSIVKLVGSNAGLQFEKYPSLQNKQNKKTPKN